MLLAFAGWGGSSPSFAIVLLVGAVEFEQLQIVFPEVVGLGEQFLANRPSQVSTGILDSLDRAQFGFGLIGRFGHYGCILSRNDKGSGHPYAKPPPHYITGPGNGGYVHASRISWANRTVKQCSSSKSGHSS